MANERATWLNESHSPALTDNKVCQVFFGFEPWGSAHKEKKTRQEVGSVNTASGVHLKSFEFTLFEALGPDNNNGLKYKLQLINPDDSIERELTESFGRIHRGVGTGTNQQAKKKAGLPIMYIQWGYLDILNPDSEFGMSKVHTAMVTDIKYELQSGKEKTYTIEGLDLATYTLNMGKSDSAIKQASADILEYTTEEQDKFTFRPMSAVVSETLGDFIQTTPGVLPIVALPEQLALLDQITLSLANQYYRDPSSTEEDIKIPTSTSSLHDESSSYEIKPDFSFDLKTLRIAVQDSTPDGDGEAASKFYALERAYRSVLMYLGIRSKIDRDFVPKSGINPKAEEARIATAPKEVLPEQSVVPLQEAYPPLIVPLCLTHHSHGLEGTQSPSLNTINNIFKAHFFGSNPVDDDHYFPTGYLVDWGVFDNGYAKWTGMSWLSTYHQRSIATSNLRPLEGVLDYPENPIKYVVGDVKLPYLAEDTIPCAPALSHPLNIQNLLLEAGAKDLVNLAHPYWRNCPCVAYPSDHPDVTAAAQKVEGGVHQQHIGAPDDSNFRNVPAILGELPTMFLGPVQGRSYDIPTNEWDDVRTGSLYASLHKFKPEKTPEGLEAEGFKGWWGKYNAKQWGERLIKLDDRLRSTGSTWNEKNFKPKVGDSEDPLLFDRRYVTLTVNSLNGQFGTTHGEYQEKVKSLLKSGGEAWGLGGPGILLGLHAKSPRVIRDEDLIERDDSFGRRHPQHSELGRGYKQIDLNDFLQVNVPRLSTPLSADDLHALLSLAIQQGTLASAFIPEDYCEWRVAKVNCGNRDSPKKFSGLVPEGTWPDNYDIFFKAPWRIFIDGIPTFYDQGQPIPRGYEAFRDTEPFSTAQAEYLDEFGPPWLYTVHTTKPLFFFSNSPNTRANCQWPKGAFKTSWKEDKLAEKIIGAWLKKVEQNRQSLAIATNNSAQLSEPANEEPKDVEVATQATNITPQVPRYRAFLTSYENSNPYNTLKAVLRKFEGLCTGRLKPNHVALGVYIFNAGQFPVDKLWESASELNASNEVSFSTTNEELTDEPKVRKQLKNSTSIITVCPQYATDTLFKYFDTESWDETMLGRHPLRCYSFPKLHTEAQRLITKYAAQSPAQVKAVLQGYKHSADPIALTFGGSDSNIISFKYEADSRYLSNMIQIPQLQMAKDAWRMHANNIKDVSAFHSDLKQFTENVKFWWRSKTEDAAELATPNDKKKVKTQKETTWLSSEVLKEALLEMERGDSNIKDTLMNDIDISNAEAIEEVLENEYMRNTLFPAIEAGDLEANTIVSLHEDGEAVLKNIEHNPEGYTRRITIPALNTLTKDTGIDKVLANEFLTHRLLLMRNHFNVTFKILGVPEMDTSWELLRRKIIIEVKDSRKYGSEADHWLSGLFRPLAVKHILSPTGYYTEVKAMKEYAFGGS